MQTTYTPVPTYVRATALQRFVAAFIDSFIGHILSWLLVIVSASLSALFDYKISISYLLTVTSIGFAISLVYLLTKDALPFLKGQSVGKKLMGIKVVKEDTGLMLTNDYTVSITRQVSLLIPFLNIIDALLVFSDEKKRFGDKWAKTVVIKA